MVDRRLQIKRDAARLFLAKGVAGTSMRDIADQVGILPGSLYHHFPSKDAIATALVVEFVDDLNARYRSVLPHVSGLRAQLRALIQSSIEVADRHPYATEVYQNESSFQSADADPRISNGVLEAHEFWIMTAQAAHVNGELSADLEPFEYARIVREAVWQAVRFHRADLAERTDDIVATFLLVFVDGPTLAARSDERSDRALLEDVQQRLARIEKSLETR